MLDTPYRAALAAVGARFDEAGDRPESFGDPVAEAQRAAGEVVLADRSDCARIVSTGKDILDLLHRLSTQDLKGLPTGRGLPAVLATGKGRIVERIFVFALEPRRIWIVGGRPPRSASEVVAHLARFTFAEDTSLSDETASTRLIVLCGPGARGLAARTGLPHPAPFECARTEIGESVVEALGFEPDGGDGVAFLVPAADAPAVWEEILRRGAAHGLVPAGDRALEARRIAGGLPASGRELTDDYNPLEAGLWNAVSFTKGCYVGQEVVARLKTYDKVSKRLVGFTVAAGVDPPAPGDRLYRDGRDVGTITSVARLSPDGPSVALAYLKRDPGPASGPVRLGNAEGSTVPRMTDFAREHGS